MPRAKRPLSQVDSNLPSIPKSQKKSKNTPKLIHANPNCPVKKADDNEDIKQQATTKLSSGQEKPIPMGENGHPEIDKSIAERFEKGIGMRMIRTYPDLQMSEMKELLEERGLKVSGKKPDLIERLEAWDKEHPSGARKVGDDHREALARQPVPIGAKASEMGPKEDDPREAMMKRGRTGPPIYDELGFELDYDLCTGGPRTKDARLNAMERSVERSENATKIKSRVVGGNVDAKPMMEEAWNDRVSRDLGIAYHMVGPDQFKEWKEKGFKATRKDIEKVLEQDGERLNFLMIGSALRKGSVR